MDADIGVKIGDVVAGKYKIERRIGSGGMGVVVCARHLQFGGKVALKILLPKAARDKEAITRFSREARAMFHLKSEHAAKVIEIGNLPNGQPFMAMEYLDGVDLATLLVRNGPLAPVEAVGIILQACEAIAEAHSLGIVHRDIKPQNLFITKRVDGAATVKVLDFGISKVPLESGEHMSLTHSSAVMGTPLYMSPEQLAASVDADAQSDVWALGVVLYEILTGHVPYDAASAPALYAKMVTTSPPSPSDVNFEIPTDLSAAVMRCLAQDRKKRCEGVAELATLLEPFAPSSMSGAGIRLRAVHQRNTELLSIPNAEVPVAENNALPTQITWEGHETRTRKRNLAAVVGVFGGAFLFVLALFAWHTKASTVDAASEMAPASSILDAPPIAPVAMSSASAAVEAAAPSAEPVPTVSAAPASKPPRTDKSHKSVAPQAADPGAFFTHRNL